MLDFLEKAGLLKRDVPAMSTEVEISTTRTDRQVNTTVSASPSSTTQENVFPSASLPSALNLDEIYAAQGVGSSLYPAERLLRLLDGLSAMDEATRQMAIKAMDAADESWTIDDPLADAAAKVQALAAHSQTVAANLQRMELETKTHMDAVNSRQEKVVSDIRQQIAELESLVARELSRAAQESAAREARLQAARDQTARDLSEVTQVSQRLQNLSRQFGDPKTTLQE
jgi:hypothetical protein